MTISIVMPAHNEASRIAHTIQQASQHADEIIVVDDGSKDDTAPIARQAGAYVAQHPHAQGYIAAIKYGFRIAHGDIIVTCDADGEHPAEDIPRLVAPILANEADLVLGVRPHIARPSERFLNWLTRLRLPDIRDSGTGFRALRHSLALQLQLSGECICGISVLEPAAYGARIRQIDITLHQVDKPRHIAWYHMHQIGYVLPWLFKRSL
jgi:glycosyltransferase involved in cell wall biosynthesis